MAPPEEQEQLIIHMGGLGDLCLAENTIRSLQHSLGSPVIGAGSRRILNLFCHYFTRIEEIGSRKFSYLFSEGVPGRRWRRIIFIGKDRTGRLRRQWQAFSAEPVLFVDMYPEGPAEGAGGNPTWVEDYQLLQLGQQGIPPQRGGVECRKGDRVILYAERASRKKGWSFENFLGLRDRLAGRGTAPLLMVPTDEREQPSGSVAIDDLGEVVRLFRRGGIFVSNDSGMAHLAGRSGLFTVTLFFMADPRIWHPRGEGLHVDLRSASLGEDSLAGLIERVLQRP